jgi:hypothetical protein
MAEDMVLAVYIPPQAPARTCVLNNSFKVLRGNRVIELFPRLQMPKQYLKTLLPFTGMNTAP